MELKKITEDQYNAHLQGKQSHTMAESLEPVVVVKLKDGVVEKISDELNTPTSPLTRIHPILACPPAPRKPKAAPLRKRKESHNTELRMLDFSNDVLALYPPALLADFGNKVKKAKVGYNYEQLKENISTILNYYTS